jgi:N-acetylneuraminic acid mutarotase
MLKHNKEGKMKSKIYSFTLITIIVLGLANQNFAQWTQLTEIPTARTFSASCEVDSIIYVLGGTGSTNTNGSGTTIMDVYSPILNSWDTTKADMPTGRVELGVCAVNKKIYAIGGAANHGSSPLGMVEEYNPLTDSWETNKTPMPTPRKGAAIGVIDNKIYVAGGTAVSNFTASNKLEIYDPATNTWETKEPMPQSMYQPQGAVVNNKFYVIGGLLGFSPWTGQKIVQMYDPITDTWSYRADLNEGRVGHTTNVIDGKIYAIGGDKQPPPIRTVEEYDPNSNNWAVIDSTPGVMVCHTASVVQSKIYVISGSTSPIHPNLNPTDAVWSYQPVKENTFQLGSFEYEGRTRNYEVYLPYNYHTNMPVVFALHGYTETVQWFKDYTQLHKLGNTTGFITVYPAAIGKSWNSGLIAPGWPYIDTTVNDVGFISALIDTLEANYDIDMNRIYCCGYSLGGEMTYRLAIELGYRFAAVASVCGLINDVSGNLGDPIRPIPILHIHGTEDNYET